MSEASDTWRINALHVTIDDKDREIEKLRNQLSILQHYRYSESDCLGCQDRAVEIDQLKTQVEFAQSELQDVITTRGSAYSHGRNQAAKEMLEMLEAEPFQILKNALDKLARLGNGDRFGNSEGNTIALKALRAVLPLDYAELEDTGED